MVKKLLFGIVTVLLLASCGKHFISDRDYRQQVHQDFKQRKELAQGRSDALFGVFKQAKREEKEALEFLYAYMPLSDLADYDGEFFLQQVRYALKARDTFSWGATIPEDIFRHFVLVYRVNNENLDSARQVFFDELKPRIENMTMYDAALEVNHWCHEKVAYRPSDSRTSAPLATVRTALGRCGEESTFTVTALRAVGIPARQCYTPRWAHTDDNHAWVEVWVDGKWHFLGACEPDPELDMGWFAIPSTRTMMVHSNAFGKYNGEGEITHRTDLFSRINMLKNYADTKQITVKVVDHDRHDVEGATVKFKLYNYAEYYPIATQTTDQNGIARLTTGLGSLLIWATDGYHYNYGQINVPKEDSVVIVIERLPGEDYTEEYTMVPPAGHSDVVTADNAKVKRNAQRLQHEDSIRNAYMATFKTEADAENIVNKNLTTEQIGLFLKKSEGNYTELIDFLNRHQQEDRYLFLYDFLNSLSDKDLRDFDKETLEDHITLYGNKPSPYSLYIYKQGIISPRIANEGLRPWRNYLKDALTASLGVNATPNSVKNWIDKHIQIDDEANYFNCPISPRGVYELRWADSHSRDIFFVAACRALNIPAYMDNATGQIYAYNNSQWNLIRFDEEKKVLPNGTLVIEYDKKQSIKPSYWTNFTLAKYEDGDFVTFDYENDPRVATFPITLELEQGYYMLSTGNRYTDGTALSRIEFFYIWPNKTTKKKLIIRSLDEQITDLGHLDLQYKPSEFQGKKTVKDIAKGHPLLLSFIDPSREPSKHLLKDIASHTDEFEKENYSIVFVLPNDKNVPDFNFKKWKLPTQSILIEDSGNQWLNNVITHTKSSFSDNFPLVIFADKDGNILFKSEGYRIGTGSQILQKM
jgi:hypothetical protein